MKIAPLARLASFCLGLAGAIVATSPLILCLFWLGVIVPACVATRTWQAHLRFVLAVATPIALMLAVVWIGVMGAPPGEMRGTDYSGATAFVSTTALRLIALGGCVQLALLTIPRDELLHTFHAWGLRRDLLLAALATFVVFPELRIRADQIVTARMARGLVADRRVWTRAMQLLPSTGVLFTLSVRAAIRRAAHWHEQGLLSEFERIAPTHRTSAACSTAAIVIALCWLTLSLVVRIGWIAI